MLRNIRLIIYDLDGVLIDSREAIVETFHRVLDELGVDRYPAEAIKEMIGEPLVDMYMRALPPSMHRLIPQCYERYVEIYRELVQCDEHPDAETLFNRVRTRLPTVSLDTIYRTLNLLEQKGVLARIDSVGDRTRFDANTDPHHHFVCTQCGRIEDVYCDEFDGLRPPQAVTSIGEAISIRVEIRGVCAACRSR